MPKFPHTHIPLIAGLLFATGSAFAAHESFHIDASVRMIEPADAKYPTAATTAPSPAQPSAEPGAAAPAAPGPQATAAPKVAVVYQTMADAAAAGVNPVAKQKTKPAEAASSEAESAPLWKRYGMQGGIALALLVGAWVFTRGRQNDDDAS